MMRPNDSGRPNRSLWSRMIGASLLKKSVYQTVAEDDFASLQAIQIVLMAMISIALAAVGLGSHPVTALAIVLRVLVMVYVFRWIARNSSSRSEHVSNAGLQRMVGFAQAPLLVTFISALPVFGVWIFVAGHIWSTLAMGLASRVYFGRDDLKALFVVALVSIITLISFTFIEPPSLPVPEQLPD